MLKTQEPVFGSRRRMTDRIEIDGLKIARELHDFVVQEALPGTGVASQ